MRKLGGFLVFFLLIFLCVNQIVLAKVNVNPTLVANQSELKEGDFVQLTLAFDDFEDIHKGVNALKGTLEYDKSIFEEIKQDDFECQNNWEGLKYNSQNGEFVAYRKTGTRFGESVVQLSFVVKKDISAATTNIKVRDLVTSEGKKDIFLNDVTVTLNIIKDQLEIPDKPIVPEEPSRPEKPSTSENVGINNSNDNFVSTNTNGTGNTSNNVEENNNSHNDEKNEENNNSFIKDDSNESNNSQNKDLVNSSKNEKTDIVQNRKLFTIEWLFIIILIQINLWAIYIRRKSKKDDKTIKNRKFMWLLITFFCAEFIGTTCALAYNFSLKGELNGDQEINYADVSLLELHLIDLKELHDDKLENADMNIDGKITVTDLSLLIQKLEKTLDYNVIITNLGSEDGAANKNQEITIKFNGDVSFGAQIEKLVINDTEYIVQKVPNTDEYTVTLLVGETSGIKDYKITKAILNNNKIVKIHYDFQIDVLKDVPSIDHYRVEENIDESKLIILFDVIDHNDSIESSYIEIYDGEDKIEIEEALVKGENRIEVEVLEEKEYTAYIVLNYNLSNDENNDEHRGLQHYEKDLQLLVDYNFHISDIKTFKENEETSIFNKDDQVKIVFHSENNTKYIPTSVKVDGKFYEVTEVNNGYAIILDAIKSIENKTYVLEEVILSNGKKFTLTEHNTITINVQKRKPSIDDLLTSELTENNQLKVAFSLIDPDNALSELKIILLNADDKEIDCLKLNRDEVKEDGTVNKFLNTEMTSKYKLKIMLNYNLTGQDNNFVDEVVKDIEIAADPRVNIKNITPSVKYVEKGGLLKLFYEIESNKTEDVTRILVNNVNALAVKIGEGKYEVTLNAKTTSGIYSLTTTRVTFADDTTATFENTIQVDVLKDIPIIENFKQVDDLEKNEVFINFDVKDQEESFINGKAILSLDGNFIEKEITKGHNELVFSVEPSKKYFLEIKATYDLDTNTLSDSVDDNKTIDGILVTKEIELIPNYELSIDNLKTYNEFKETKYFAKTEAIKVGFKSTNITTFEPVRVVVSGVEYALTKLENTYYFTIEGYKISGVKTASIEKIILNNSKEIIISENNEIKVTVLKDKPTVEKFGYKENMDGTISATFYVIDEEDTIMGGKVYIINHGVVIKEQNIEKGSNTITFQPQENQNYNIKVSSDYDLDMNVLENDANEYKNVTLLLADITLGDRKFEMKDIIRTSIYKQTNDGVVEVENLKESDLVNLNEYIVKVYMKEMPIFYTTVTGYRIEGNKLMLTLAYDNVVSYTEDARKDTLEIEYGEIVDGVAENITLEGLIKEIEANPTGEFTLTRNYDASLITTNSATLISSSFMGKLIGNGYKIYNLSKPLFDTLESATIENLILESPKLSGVNSKGAIANSAINSTIKNVHVKNLTLITGANKTGGIIGEATSTNVENSSVTNFSITTSGHIRVAAIVGNMIGGSIRNCYVEGKLLSTQNKDGNGISGILGTGEGTSLITVENCLTNVKYTNNVSARLNGDIVGLSLNANTVLKNNVSLSTGTNFYSIHGSNIHSTSTNNYELLDSGLVSNAYQNRVKQISKDSITKEFFKESAMFDEEIWDLTNISYTNLPKLKSDNQQDEEDKVTNNKLYIPDYSRIIKINGYDSKKDILYHNINKLMPYYDAKYLIEDGLKIAIDHELNTKIIKHILAYNNEGKMLTYITSKNYNSIVKIKLVFDDNSVSEYNVSFKELKQNITIYKLEGLELDYSYDNYVVKDGTTIETILVDYIKNVDYTKILDPLTTAADSRLYRDHFNEVMKKLANEIVLQLLQNDVALTIDNEILNNKIKQELIDSGRFNRILYAYNYIHRWYQFEIGGSKVSDIILFEGKMYKDFMTLDNLTNDVLTGNIATNATHTFYVNSLKKYTGSANLGVFLDSIITNIGGYEDINDWFTEHFSSIGVLSEIPVESHPEVMYRAWARLKGFQNFILPLSTLPKYAGYIVSGPAQFQIGAQRVYTKDPDTEAGQIAIKNIVNNHSKLIKRQFDTLAGTFHVESWNNFTILVYDTCKTITGYKTSYIPGTNIPIGTSPVTTVNKAGTTTEPFHKNFNEAVGAWQYGSAAGVGNTAGFLWFIVRPGLTNYDTWTHEFEHALWDKIMMFRKGTRLELESYTEGNTEQNETWSHNNLNGYDVGPYYFNLAFTLNKEGFATQNLTPERINTREKLENYYKGQLDALELLDYVSAKAFITLTPEEQAKIATRMNQSAGWSTWGTITSNQAKAMNLTSLEALWDNRIILRPNNAWGVSVRGLTPINSIGANDYGYESIWVTRWYMGHYDNGYSDALSNKKNFFEMLGYGGVDAYVTYGSRMSSSDLDAIQKVTLAKTGKAMNWKEYRMSRYAEIESKLNNKYVNIDLMIEQFKNALKSDAKNGNRNITSATNLRKIYYHYLKRVTNDFIDDPLGTTIEMTHIKTAEELVDKINAEPYGYYILDNDIDFSNMTRNVTQTFMGKLDGNGHKIIGNKVSIFQKIRYGYVKDLVLSKTDIPMSYTNVGALAVKTEYSVLENVKAIDLQMNFGNRNDSSLIGGAASMTITSGLEVETLKNKITSIEDLKMLNEKPGSIFVLEKDLDFTGYTGVGSVVTGTFTGKLDGNGYTLSNLNNLSLFNAITGTVENLNIRDFKNIAPNTDDITSFAKLTNGATLRNLKFENITLEGRHRVATVVSFDNANSTFENISVKNSSIKASGVYSSAFVGRKYGGTIKNVYVDGNMEITTTENGGVVGALQKGGTVENVISRVNIHKTANTYTNVAESEHNGGIVGNIYDSPIIKNSIALGDMKGFKGSDGIEKIPFKFTGAKAQINLSTIDNCYEYQNAKGFSSITKETEAKIKDATSTQIHTKSFYQEILHFDENIWNLDTIKNNGYPELK